MWDAGWFYKRKTRLLSYDVLNKAVQLNIDFITSEGTKQKGGNQCKNALQFAEIGNGPTTIGDVIKSMFNNCISLS